MKPGIKKPGTGQGERKMSEMTEVKKRVGRGFSIADFNKIDLSHKSDPKPSAADIGYGLRQIELGMDEFRAGKRTNAIVDVDTVTVSKKRTKRQKAVNTKAEIISDDEYEWYIANCR